MPVLTHTQEPSWNNNIYVLSTTRIFVLVGTAYLARSLYHLVSPTWGSRPASILASALSGLGPDPDLEANLTLSVQRPQRSYDPQGHVQRSQASPGAHGQPVATPETSVAADATPEQDVGVRNYGGLVQEGSEVSVGLVD